jgi:septum formation protein
LSDCWLPGLGKALVLASASPRRREILAMAGIPFEAAPSGIEEIPMPGNPENVVIHWARMKAERVVPDWEDRAVLGADTMVELGGRLLGKPADRDEAVSMLLDLSGAWHTVLGGVCVIWPERGLDLCFAESTRVRFRPLSRLEIECYANTGEPMDKAGAYGIQGFGCAMVDRIEGCYFNVMGLPVARLVREISDRIGKGCKR